MSGWTILTVRGEPANRYSGTEKDWEYDRSYANKDLAVTLDNHELVRDTQVRGEEVHLLLTLDRYDFDGAVAITEEFSEAIDDFGVLGWNDTTDTGAARYYPTAGSKRYTLEFEEEDPHYGKKASAAVYAHSGLEILDPFHNQKRDWTTKYLDQGCNIED